MARRDALIATAQTQLDPGEVATHAFAVVMGPTRRSNNFLIIALTDRNVVLLNASHWVKWKALNVKERLPRAPLPDLPKELSFPGFRHWSFQGLDLWLDRPAVQEAYDLNAALGG